MQVGRAESKQPSSEFPWWHWLKIIDDGIISEATLVDLYESPGLEFERLQDIIGHVGPALGGWGLPGHRLGSVKGTRSGIRAKSLCGLASADLKALPGHLRSLTERNGLSCELSLHIKATSFRFSECQRKKQTKKKPNRELTKHASGSLVTTFH